MVLDPFAIKKYPKWHPYRLAFTARARLIEREARQNFEKYKIPYKIIQNLPEVTDCDFSDTAVTPLQAQHLIHALQSTEHLQDTVVVEIGSYRGITTKLLASSTKRQVIAVDPYIDYGGSEEDYTHFQRNTDNISNITHIRKTSGGAAKNWDHLPISLIFIDALHDYVNTAFDIASWLPMLVSGGLLTLHDTDQLTFAGTRKAVFEAYSSPDYPCTKYLDLWAHPDNMVIFTKR